MKVIDKLEILSTFVSPLLTTILDNFIFYGDDWSCRTHTQRKKNLITLKFYSCRENPLAYTLTVEIFAVG